MTGDQDIVGRVWRLIEDAESLTDAGYAERMLARDYYDGKVDDPEPEDADEKEAFKGRSKAVASIVRAKIKKVMPSLMRSLIGNNRIVEYEPISEEQEQAASDASDYVNFVAIPDGGIEDALNDAVMDALLYSTGILKWSLRKRERVRIRKYSRVSLDDMLGLDVDFNGEVFSEEAHEDGAISFNLRVRKTEKQARIGAVDRESFLISPDADCIEDASLVGERLLMSRSELVSSGIDKDIVAGLPSWGGGDDISDIDRERSDAVTENQLVRVYEVYVRLDLDDDGIAEIYYILMSDRSSGDEAEATILDMEPVDEAPYSEVKTEREPHEFEGRALSKDLMESQRIKTVFLRGASDNIAWQNNRQIAVDVNQIAPGYEDGVFNPKFGGVIGLRPGGKISDAFQVVDVPFAAGSIFEMMSVIDEEASDRTGVTDQSGGIDPQSFANMSATATQIINDAGMAQAEMMIRTLARGGIRKAFKGFLNLVIANADGEVSRRVGKSFRKFNPAAWPVDMDCVVNVGVGAGAPGRGLAMLQLILGIQRELIAATGPNGPLVKPKHLYNTIEQIVETAGFASAGHFFSEPQPGEVEAMASQNAPSEAEIKAQTAMQIEQAKADARKQVEEAQMVADLRVKEAEMAKQMQIEQMKAENDREIARMEAEMRLTAVREKIEGDLLKAGMSADIERQKIKAGSLYET